VSRTPRVSFVVPCYNYGCYLPECLSSIFSQEDERDFEVIVIDDGSTDSTARVLASCAEPRLRVVTHPVNLGHIATINEGLSLARGEFVARIDPDDRYRPRFLAATLAVFEAFPDVGLVYGNAALIDAAGRVTAERIDRIHGGRDFKGNEFLLLLEDNCICAPTAIARRELWRQALPAPAGLAFNDWYFNVMIARRCEFYYLDRVLAEYRVHAGNHHVRVIREKTEEPSVFFILDRVFSETECSQSLEDAKRRSRYRIYGRHYLTLADKYFGISMNRDARRCYCAAVRHRPRYLLNAGILRRWAATLVGRDRYELGKALIKGATSASSS
jgi:glycosyltransferase involved in cell wall biosynthesis